MPPVRTLLESLRQMMAYAPAVIAYGALAGFVSAVVIAPLASWATESLLGMSGRVAVSNADLATFLFSPSGVAMLAGTGALLVFAQLFDESLIYARLELKGQNALKPLLAVVRLSHKLFLAGLVQSVVYGLLCLPLLILLLALWRWLLWEQDINFYLAERPREFWTAGVIGGLGGLATGLALFVASAAMARMSPLIVLDEMSVLRSLEESVRQLRAKFRTTLETLALHAGATLVIAAVAAVVLRSVTEGILLAVPDQTLVVALVAGALLLTNGIVLAMIGFLSTSTRAGAIWLIDGRHDGRAQIKVDWEILPRLKLKLAVWVIGLGAFAIAEAWLLDRLSDRAYRLGQVQIVAHRGSSIDAPENSLAAFQRAVEVGADWIELDVQRSVDGVIVVAHDRDLRRISGDPREVRDSTGAELAKIDVGSMRGKEFASERLPTLDEVLGLSLGRTGLMIELKYNRPDKELAGAVASRLKNEHGRVAVLSLNLEALAQIRRESPSLQTGLLVSASAGNLLRVDADFLAVSQNIATPWFIDRARGAGKPVYVWTVNSEQEMLRLMSLGVSGIITDDPALGVRVRDRFREMSVPDLIRLFVNSRLRK